jgi:tRNA(Ile)-lysidine synthase
VPFSIDPTNRDPHFLRARVRHELIPLLETMSPRIVEHLCALADQLRGTPDPLAGLPRTTRDALAKMARERRENAWVALAGGLAARFDRTNVDLVLERRTKSRASSRK